MFVCIRMVELSIPQMISVEHCWHETSSEIPTHSQRNLSQCHCSPRMMWTLLGLKLVVCG